MSKIIIENRSNVSWGIVLRLVAQVIDDGRISETSKGKQYCFATHFKRFGVYVYADKNKKSDRFVITRET